MYVCVNNCFELVGIVLSFLKEGRMLKCIAWQKNVDEELPGGCGVPIVLM